MNKFNYYDIIIVGAGPSGIFTAYQLIKNNVNKSILLIDAGHKIEKRFCPKLKTNNCMNCSPCAITSGFSGAGAFSDGKLSLSADVGGDLPELIGKEETEKLIKYVDDVYLSFGADKKIEGLHDLSAIRKRVINANLKLIEDPIRHLGTEKAQEVYFNIQKFLIDHNITVLDQTKMIDLKIEEGIVKGIITEKGSSFADKVILALGRVGSEQLSKLCKTYNINHKPGTVDIGVRVECRNEIMQEINDILYEGKLIGYPKPFKNKVRTFCQNPGGFVSEEKYNDGLSLVNGHSYKEKKTKNTNFSILCSHNFTTPFNKPISYAKKVGELTNMLGNNHILVQRFGDILDGKRTWQEELNRGNLIPTLSDAVAGDITSAIPYRTMTNIIEFIFMLDKIVPGIANTETLLYAPEIKFYSNKIDLNKNLETNIQNLYCLGDASGWTRGLMMSSVMGTYLANMLSKEF